MHRGLRADAGVKRFDDEGGMPTVKKIEEKKMCAVDESGEASNRKGLAAAGIDKNIEKCQHS